MYNLCVVDFGVVFEDVDLCVVEFIDWFEVKLVVCDVDVLFDYCW